jgi:hypothetical protein
LQEESNRNPDNAMYGLLPLVPELQFAPEDWNPENVPVLEFGCENVKEGLKDTGITCEPLTEELLGRYLDYFVRAEIIPAPTNLSTTTDTGSEVVAS